MGPFSKLTRFAVVVAGCTALGTAAFAVTIDAMSVASDGTASYSGVKREAWLKSSTGGYAVGDVTGTPKEDDVEDLFGGTWLKEGELTGVGSNDLLTVTLTSGTWGNGPLYGTWTIDASFWTMYEKAVITMHVGNGSGNPDWFLWEITSGETNGTFYYKRKTGGGGGLSCMFLFGSGEPHQVSEAGTSVALLGAGLILLGLFRRKVA